MRISLNIDLDSNIDEVDIDKKIEKHYMAIKALKLMKQYLELNASNIKEEA